MISAIGIIYNRELKHQSGLTAVSTCDDFLVFCLDLLVRLLLYEFDFNFNPVHPM